MMHIVHSIFSEAGNQNQSKIPTDHQYPTDDFNLKLQAHQQICNKYRDEIMAIRKYLPGWEPKFSCE
jgi:hypothetical protein